MPLTSFALVLALTQRPVDQYTLGYLGDTFIVRKGATKESIARQSAEAPERTSVSFRKDRRWAVWDERGLTTRDGDWSNTERLDAISVSPKAQSKAGIATTIARIKAGKRTRGAVGLSGARRIGTMVYLLPRWEETDGTPWLEALVAVDLAQTHPKAKFLGTFGGISLGRKAIDDRLDIADGRLTLPVNAPTSWGIATYDPKRERFALNARGLRLLDYGPEDRIVETTAYGTTLAGRSDEGRTIPWMETRGAAAFVPGEGPVMVQAVDRLRNAVTGAEIRIAKGAAVRRSKAGVLVFWPEDRPRSARLYEPGRFEERARWEFGTK